MSLFARGRRALRAGSSERPPATEPRYSPTAGLPFDDAELESKLVWIFGSPRSGSTWLLEMLCHPFRMDPHEDVGFRLPPTWRGPVFTLPVNEFQIGAHLAPGMYGDSTVGSTIEDQDGTLVPRTRKRVNEYFASYAFSSAYADVWAPEARRMTLVRLFAVIERVRRTDLDLAEKLPLLVIKEVNGAHGADVVMPLFPRSRMIFLLRDGRDVVDSILDANSPDGWLTKLGWGLGGFSAPDERRRFLREAALQWVARMNVCERAYDAHDASLRMKVRYEDLLSDPTGHLEKLERWFPVPTGPKRLQSVVAQHSFGTIPDAGKGHGKFRRAASPGGWRESLTYEEQDMLQEIMAPTMRRLGYE
jgi:hypothetical protein